MDNMDNTDISPWKHYIPSEELANSLQVDAKGSWVYSYNCGIEAEAAGRAPNKGIMTLRHDLATLPFLLAGSNDIVLAPPQRPEFLQSLKMAGFSKLPIFIEKVPSDRAVSGYRPFGTPGDHIRRSNIAKYRDDVAVCSDLNEIQDAILKFGPNVVLKSEFSSLKSEL